MSDALARIIGRLRLRNSVSTISYKDGTTNFVVGNQVVVQTRADQGRLVVGFVDRTLVPNWPDEPSWYPGYAAVADQIALHLIETRKQ